MENMGFKELYNIMLAEAYVERDRLERPEFMNDFLKKWKGKLKVVELQICADEEMKYA